MQLNPIHLRALAEVAAAGSFASAARRLGYTTSAVSQQIASLERETGVQLFHRTSRTVHLTSEGEALLPQVERVLSELERLEETSSALAAGRQGRLIIGSFPTALGRLTAPAIEGLARSSPELEIRLREGEPAGLLPAVVNRQIDVAIVYEYTACPARWPDALHVAPILDERLLLLLPERHALGDAGAELGRLANERWVSSLEGTSGATALERLSAEAGFCPDVRFRTNDYSAVRSFVAVGLGIALVPALAWEPTPRVRALPLEVDRSARRVMAVSRRVHHSPLIDPFLAMVRRAAASMSSVGHLRVPEPTSKTLGVPASQAPGGSSIPSRGLFTTAGAPKPPHRLLDRQAGA